MKKCISAICNSSNKPAFESFTHVDPKTGKFTGWTIKIKADTQDEPVSDAEGRRLA